MMCLSNQRSAQIRIRLSRPLDREMTCSFDLPLWVLSCRDLLADRIRQGPGVVHGHDMTVSPLIKYFARPALTIGRHDRASTGQRFDQHSAQAFPIRALNENIRAGEEPVRLSAPTVKINAIREPKSKHSSVAMMTLNKMGHILTTENGLEVAKTEYPSDVALSLLTTKEPNVFLSQNSDGQERAYVIVPIVPGTVFALSVWPSNTPFLDTGVSTRLSALLPIVMWLASLIVAFWALNRLAINHIRKLGRQMRRFALNRTLPRGTLGPSVPTELVEMESAFVGMAESILRDEATLEDSLRQKNILLKEVHHRVKNNLQLISSIMNMQIRQAKSEDARFVLRRLQDRILSLATVHKNLYQNDDLVRVNASELLREIVGQMLSVGLPSGSGVKVEQSFEPIKIDADDAAPLTLLVSEALTNALKYVSTVEHGKGFISLKLIQTGPEQAMLEVRNTIGNPEEVKSGTGLGSRLILAFTRQLNGQVEVETNDDIYQIRVNFHVPTDSKMIYDY